MATVSWTTSDFTVEVNDDEIFYAGDTANFEEEDPSFTLVLATQYDDDQRGVMGNGLTHVQVTGVDPG